MFGKMKKFAAVICFGTQVMISVLYGFTGVGISKYVCLIIWLACGALEILLLKENHCCSDSGQSIHSPVR